ncbi:helix-turn-helix domain-containing protein [Weissella ceti]|uniref:helix-turn-helix domain-containing protein n=1 Tax=Weissella ceti TaxID=759620 RepID=UPI001BCD68E1|nr:helix-turn-helix transcriptional regulator [Weissella ceti]QVK11691.1 helix-turn-helix transcriptional regulator [Weissella ceti]
MDIFMRTKQLADLQGLSLSQLALKAGLSEKTLYRWRTGNPKFETIAQVAKALNVPTNVLLYDAPEEELIEFETDITAEPFDLSNPNKIRWDEYQTVKVTGDASNTLDASAVVTIEYHRVPAGLKTKKGDANWRVQSVVKIPFGYLDQPDSDFVQEKYRDYQIATFALIKNEIEKRLNIDTKQNEPIDLMAIVNRADRNDLMVANGQVISDETWVAIEKSLNAN